ncbi:multiple sugar transport system substrate-binding protein [Arthrobacter silviterrae]|uniref:Extracellular solute-binding protein n=1 Tax=Arthrobacter silviterrae TaxID=2026658 RepID=A0ABX0DDU8_9MICC|nr:extracellular solute-binding protein [Arthrobacter silviterrae]MDQ0277875.1 multiple sugar transport system substrate-binding protein [Arthrobacter silviterrae]NGN85069.1 extracellular solute-binding protein [Arthrobacter silviterrae]
MTIHMSRRQLGHAALGVAALGLLSACGKGNSGTSADGTTTLRFTWWGNDVRNASTDKLITAFTAANPKIKVGAEPGVWSSYWDKLATQTAGNDMPDIIQMDQQYIAEYGGRGALLDLAGQKAIDTSGLTPEALKSGQVGGKQFGISTGQNAYVIMANTRLFKEARVAIPDDTTWTWDDYISTAAAVAAKVPKSFGAAYGGTEAALTVWFGQNGENLYTADGKLGFTEGTLQAYYERLIKQRDAKAGPSASQNSEDATAAVEQTLFGTGQLAMSWWWTNQVGALAKATGDDIKILRVPSVAGSAAKASMYFKPSMFWSASARTKHAGEVAKFINYLMNDVDAAKVQLTDRGFPSNPKLQEAITPLLKPADKSAGDFLKAIEPEVSWTPAVPPVGTGTLANVSLRYVDDVLFNRKTPAVAAKEFKAEAEGLISSAAK